MSSVPPFVRRFRGPIIVVVLLLAVTAGPFLYLNVLKDDPAPRLSLSDVTTTTAVPGDGSTSSTSTNGGGTATGIDGTWRIASQSKVQYRVKETLFGQSAEATGTADGITGTATIAGTAVSAVEVEVDMTTFASDESRRDGQFQGRIMETSQFPTAAFSLRDPIELGSVPADGKEVTVSATGKLTMHGVTKTITFDAVAKRTGSSFAVNATVPITFTDYGIDDPSGGPASVGTNGELELLLVFSR